MPRAAAAALVLLLAACPGSSNCPPAREGGGVPAVQVRGRVVDFETCLTTSGCQGIADVRVALFHNKQVFSAPTTQSGAFALPGVADGARHFLLVTDASGQVLPTLQAEPIDTHGGDVTGVELFAVRRSGGLYSGISSDAAVDIKTHALYLGQVLSVEGGNMKAIPDVAISTAPAADIRYVNCIPSFSQCAGQPTLFSSRSSTGVFGQFVVISRSGAGDHAIWGSSTQASFDATTVPLGVGYLTVGLHRSTGQPPAPGDGGA